VEAALVEEFIVDRVTARKGSIHVAIRGLSAEKAEIVSRVADIAQHVSGVKAVSVDVVETTIKWWRTGQE
jgi:hypothetical protein